MSAAFMYRLSVQHETASNEPDIPERGAGALERPPAAESDRDRHVEQPPASS